MTIACFGEVLLRLTAPPGERMAHASSLAVHCGGAEANVAALLAQLGHGAEVVSVVSGSQLGDLCQSELRRVGVGTRHLLRSGDRIGLYFFEPALDGSIVYDRQHSAFAEHSDAFEWPAIAEGVRWFHLSGINLALGGKPAAAALAAVEAMRSAGATISFDVNHRASLWKDRSPEEFDRVRTVAGQADVLFASAMDIAAMLKLDVAAASPADAFAAFERLRFVASTRRLRGEQGQRLAVRIDARDGSHETDAAPIGVVVDRIGSGDAFAGGVIDGLLRQASLKDCAETGLATAVMKHGIVGDRWLGTREELDSFDPFARGDVRR